MAFTKDTLLKCLTFLVMSKYLVCADVTLSPSSSHDIDIEKELNDGSAAKAIEEMMAKFEEVLDQQDCASDEAPRRPCLDLTSGQSVLTQLCDRITSLESKLATVTSQVRTVQRSTSSSSNNHNGKGNNNSNNNSNNNNNVNDSSNTPQLDTIKSEIDKLKKSSAFYASRQDRVGNFTHEKIINYIASVNSGVNFNPNDGVFKAPFPGVYHFALSFRKTPEVDLAASLVVDNVVIGEADDSERGHISLLTSLRPGQEVWTDLTTNSTPGDSQVTFTFSGFLVH